MSEVQLPSDAGAGAGAESASSQGHATRRRTDFLRIGRVPVHFFVVAVISFAAGACAAPFVAGSIVQFFYRGDVLALVHTFTLGWITAAIMGVMYRYVPALTHRPIRYPRMALWQLVFFLIGTIGMVAHFDNGIWVGIWSSAAFVVVSIMMFAANMVPCLYPKIGKGVAETGMAIAILMLLVAGTVGFLLALDKSYDFLTGNIFTNIAGHAAFAALGWITLTICAVSYRMLPAFLLPRIQLPRAAVWQMWALAGATVALGITLLAETPGATLWSVVVALSLLAYMITIGRLVASRRMPLDLTVGHAIAGIVWLVAAVVSGLALSVTGPLGETGNRLAAAYGAAGLLGWVSNFIIGMSYQLFPGFVTRIRADRGWQPATIAEISIGRPRLFVFLSFNLGVALLVAGFLDASSLLARVGSCAIAVAALTYGACILWTLSYAYRRSMPRAAARNPLRILPS